MLFYNFSEPFLESWTAFLLKLIPINVATAITMMSVIGNSTRYIKEIPPAALPSVFFFSVFSPLRRGSQLRNNRRRRNISERCGVLYFALYCFRDVHNSRYNAFYSSLGTLYSHYQT